jgi:pilus assembly protein CpaD
METAKMKRAPSLAAIALGLALAGCGPVNRGLETVHQPVISRSNYALDVSVDATGLRYGEERRLTGWFDSLRLGYGDRVAVDDPDPTAAGAHREAIAGITSRYGLLLDRTPPVTERAVPPGTVRIVISRSSAEVPACPDWSRPSQPEFQASTTSNYGCANSANLAAMVANPQDLIVGQSGSAIRDTRSVTKAIKTYRDLAPTGGEKMEKTSSKEGGN